MPDSIPNLWPQDLKWDVQTPLFILRTQSEQLRTLTRGILIGEVLTTNGPEDEMLHSLTATAPAYNGGYRVTLLSLKHGKDKPYPVEIQAEGLEEVGGYEEASSEDELIVFLQKALRSDSAKAKLQSLIALSNEAKLTTVAS